MVSQERVAPSCGRGTFLWGKQSKRTTLYFIPQAFYSGMGHGVKPRLGVPRAIVLHRLDCYNYGS